MAQRRLRAAFQRARAQWRLDNRRTRSSTTTEGHAHASPPFPPLPPRSPNEPDRRGRPRLRKRRDRGPAGGRLDGYRRGATTLRLIRTRGVARHDGQRRCGKRLLRPRDHQPVPPRVHARGLPRGLCDQPGRPAARQLGVARQRPRAAHDHARERQRPRQCERNGDGRAAHRGRGQLPALELRSDNRRGPARLPARPDRVEGRAVPVSRVLAPGPGDPAGGGARAGPPRRLRAQALPPGRRAPSTQVAWKPSGTRSGSPSRQTGPSLSARASSTCTSELCSRSS